MADIGIRELKIHASTIIHQVKEKRMKYVVTHRGHPVAVIIPIDEVHPMTETGKSVLAELEALGQQISQNWQSDQTSTEILSNQRR